MTLSDLKILDRQAPLPYWLLVSWARKLTRDQLPKVLAETISTGWFCTQGDSNTITVNQVLQEVVNRFDEFNADHFSWEYYDESDVCPHRQKYLLGRDLARSYIQDSVTGLSNPTFRSQLLHSQQATWSEWIIANELAGFGSMEVCEATTLALDHIVSRDVTPGVGIVAMFCLARNVAWYYYLSTLPKIEMVDNGGSMLAVLAPLIGISVVLVLSVGIVWLVVLNQYLVKVVTSAQGRAGYTSADVVATMPRLAKLLYLARPGN